MRRPTQRQKPQKAKLTSFPAPTGGLVSNRNLAMARSPDMPPGAAVMDDWFPTATGAILRRGSIRKASMVEDETVETLFSYSSGNTKEFFAASASGIRDITTVADPDTFSGPDVLTGQTSGNWNVVQFATSGGEFLVGVNGEDEGFLYDGDTFYPSVDGGIYGFDYDALTVSFSVGETVTGGSSSATAEIVKVIESGTTGRLWVKEVTGTFTDNEAITDGAGGSADADGTTGLLASGISFPSGVSKTTADLSYVWVYKQRVWFIEKDSLNAWYLPVDQVGGELTLWPMGGVFVRGGALTWAQDWSLDSGGSGGLSEQCVFCTTEGEVAAYQGLSPEVDQGWTKVGVYRIGRPLGDKAFMRAGGDIVIATTVGFVSLAAASRQDYAALGQNAVSYPIEDDWAQAIAERGQLDWRCAVWADGQMAVISPPAISGTVAMVFVVNVNTGKWCRFRNWPVESLGVFNGNLFFGSSDGSIRQAWVGGADEGMPYTGQFLPLFEDMGAPGSLKIAKMARVVSRSSYEANAALSGHSNFVPRWPAAPSIPAEPAGSEWESGIWDTSTWNTPRAGVVEATWVPIGTSGHDLSIGVQVTSGSTIPVDAEIVRIDMTYTTGQAVS